MSTPEKRKEQWRIRREYEPKTNKSRKNLGVSTHGYTEENYSEEQINEKVKNIDINTVDPFEDILNPFNNMNIERNKSENIERTYEEIKQDQLDRERTENKKRRERIERQERIIDEHNNRIERQQRKENRKNKIKDIFSDLIKSLRKPFIKIAAIGVAAATLLPAAAAVSKDNKNDTQDNEPKDKLVDTNANNNRANNNDIFDQVYDEVTSNNKEDKGRISELTDNTNKKQIIGNVENKIKSFLSHKKINNINKMFISANNIYSAQIINVNPQTGAVKETFTSIGGYLTSEQKQALDIINSLNSNNLASNKEREYLDELHELEQIIEEQLSELDNNNFKSKTTEQDEIDR